MAKIDIALTKVTPEEAAELLERGGPNRKLNESQVDRFATDMLAGNWRSAETTETIKLGPRGSLEDGQHRLAAVVKAARAQLFWIARGVPAAAIEMVDTGRSRSFSDVLTMGGGNSSHSRRLAATLKWIWHYEHDSALTSGRAVSHAELKRTLEEHPGAMEGVERAYASRDITPQSIVAFVYTLAREKKPRKADEWLEAVQEGADIGRNHPAFVVRRKFRRVDSASGQHQMRGPYAAALLIKSWNAFIAGEEVSTLDWRPKGNKEEEFPKIGG
ncbi:MAG: hypothetical protein ABIT38_12585 [Gemmatimonadaceae bacterium]